MTPVRIQTLHFMYQMTDTLLYLSEYRHFTIPVRIQTLYMSEYRHFTIPVKILTLYSQASDDRQVTIPVRILYTYQDIFQTTNTLLNLLEYRNFALSAR